MEISLGHGNYMIVGIDRDGRDGLAIKKMDVPHEVNSCSDEEPSPFVPAEDDVVIFFDNIEGARVLQDQVNVACLRLNGFDVKNAEEQNGE